MAITAEREEKVNFSSPYYRSGAQLFIHKDLADEIEDIDDVGDRKIGVVIGETFEQFLRKNHPEINVAGYKGTSEIFQDVKLGNIAGFVSDRLLGAYQIKEAGMPFVPSGPLLYQERMGIPVTKQNTELLADINAALSKMRESGELDTLFNKWFAITAASKTYEIDADAKPFRVALTGKYPPFSMYDTLGDVVGFDVDMSREISKRLGRPVKIITTEWDGILPGLLAGKYDAIIGSMAITDERREKVNFSKPYYRSGAQLFIHEDLVGEIKNIDDVGKRKIGVVIGETFEQFLRKNHPEINVAGYKGTSEIFQDVELGNISGFVSDRLLGAYQIKQAGKPFVPAGPMLYEEQMGIPVTKDNPQLLANINAALSDMQATGVADNVYDNWFGLGQSGPGERGDTSMKSSTIVRLLLSGFALTLFVAFCSLTIGFLVSVPWGILLNRDPGLGHFLLRGVNDFIRGTPVLIQLLFVYFGLGYLTKQYLNLSIAPVPAAIFTLSVNASAYMAEVVRSGLMSVPPGQAKAGRALGLSQTQIFFNIVWPQAFRIAMPPLMNSVVALIKDTALIMIISVPEIISQAQSIIAVTYDPMRYYLIVAVMFFVVTFPLMKLAGWLERQIKQKGFQNA
jgi:glutamine transport system permease protein